MTHFDLDELRVQARKLAEARREARRDYERYAAEEAQADHDYRVIRAKEFAKRRINGESANGAEIHSNAAAAEAKMKRDIAHSLAKSADLRIEELEADRAMLRQLGDWSMKLEGLPQPQWSDTKAA